MNVLKGNLGKMQAGWRKNAENVHIFFYVQASFWSSVNRYAKVNPSFLPRIRLKNSSGCSRVGSLFINEQHVPALPMFPLYQ